VRLRLQNVGADYASSRGAGAGPRIRLGILGSSPLLFAGALVLIGITIGVIHNKWHHARRSDPLLGATSSFLYPAQAGGARARSLVGFSWDALFAGARLERENLQLQQDNARLEQENESLRSQAEDAIRLRAELGFVRLARPAPVVADVIGWLPASGLDTVIVGAGGHGGIHPGAVACTPAGLVGQVTEVGPLSAEVLLLSDVSSNVGVLVQRGGKTIGDGIVQGAGRDQPLMLAVLHRTDDPRPGDRLVTSGYGDVFPPQIPIGTIGAVTAGEASFLKHATVVPAAPLPGDLHELLIVPAAEMPPLPSDMAAPPSKPSTQDAAISLGGVGGLAASVPSGSDATGTTAAVPDVAPTTPSAAASGR
jgi:rod shape-determining protein MreC